MLHISNSLNIPDNEIELSAVRSQGAGGQNVNKVATAIHLRFDVLSSSLPDVYKKRLLQSNDKRINKDGVIVIKAQTYRTQEKNRDAALARLSELIKSVTTTKKKRIRTRPTLASKVKRMDAKSKRGKEKQLRRGIRNID